MDNVVRPIIKKDCDDSLPKLSYHSLQRFKQKFPIQLNKGDLIDTLLTGDFIEFKRIYTNNILKDKIINSIDIYIKTYKGIER